MTRIGHDLLTPFEALLSATAIVPPPPPPSSASSSSSSSSSQTSSTSTTMSIASSTTTAARIAIKSLTPATLHPTALSIVLLAFDVALQSVRDRIRVVR
jgi:hypothetical protein